MFELSITDNTVLRPLEPWQAAEFAAHIERARGYIAPWIPFAREVTDLETARGFLQRYAERLARDDGRLYGLWLDGTLSGGALFRTFDANSGVCELGVWLEPSAEGRGLITRTMPHLLQWAFEVRGMTRVEWRAASTNDRSIAVAKRLGMKREGVLRQATLVGEFRYDLEVWSLLAEEWRARRADSPRDYIESTVE